ncbi:MAG: proprotein convertase P-domain-containing protein [Pseudomonadota bacterium]
MKMPDMRRTVLAVIAAGLLLAFGGCGKELPAAFPDATDVGSTYEDLLGFLDGYVSAGLPAETDPTLVILYPGTGVEVWLDEIATTVDMTFAVENLLWPKAGMSVTCSIDDELDSGATGDDSHTFGDVPVGVHQLCCTLTQGGQPLTNCEATACSQITVTRLCEYLTDPDCDDGNPCSASACLYDLDLDHRKCVYGPLDDPLCCNSFYDCECGANGWQVCSEGHCADCVVDDDCDDDNPCTNGYCTAGACSYAWIGTVDGLCCTGTAADGTICADGAYCTTDICADIDPVTGVGHCFNPDAGFPDCCDTHGDCEDGDPCTVNACMAHECREGPLDDPLCCNPANGDSDCLTGNSCVYGLCDPATNQCEYEDLGFADQQLLGIHCCEVHPDCMPGGVWEEDGDGDLDPGPDDPATLDFCQNGQCQHVLNPAYCGCMEGEGCEYPCEIDANICTQDQCINNICLHSNVAGCCNVPTDCADGNVCTVETCVDHDCVYTTTPGCCNTHAQCDDGNPCNQDVCLSHHCHYGPDPDFPDCCTTDAACNDYHSCTAEYCHLGTNTCLYSLVPDQDPLCCFVASQCDDGDPSTTELCYKNECLNLTAPGSACTTAADCEDYEPCTEDLCDPDTDVCQFVWISGCCTSDFACNLAPLMPDTPEYDCKKGSCNPVTNTCVFTDISLCCDENADCDDGVACTSDYCIDSECRFVAQANCCTADPQCDDENECTADYCQMNGAAGTCQVAVSPNGNCCTTVEDCSDGDICTQDLCLGYFCYHTQVECCTPATEDVVCPDDNPCTCDLCIYGSCRHIPPNQAANFSGCNVPPTCCVNDGDCATDSNPCTTDACVNNLCAYTLEDPCTLDLPFTESFDDCNNTQPQQGWLTGNGWHFVYGGAVNPMSNWSCTTSGDLGPSKHQRFSWAPTRSDFESYLITPALDAAGYAYVTVQYWEEFDYYDDVVPKTDIERALWVIEDSAAPPGPDAGDVYHQIWVDTDTQADAEENLHHSTISATTGWLSNELYVAWSVGGNTSYAMNHLDLDDVRVCPGRPPVFANPAGSSVSEAVRLNAVVVKDFLVGDADGSALTFSLIGAPDFVTYTVQYHPGQKNYTVRVRVKPTEVSDLGQHELVVVATDGCLEERMTIDLWILIDEGYVVWDPEDSPWLSTFGDALEDAIDANDRVVQRLSDITLFQSLSGVTGVFITTGVQGVDYVLTDTPAADGAAIELLVDYLADGGRVYLEGGNTWGFDSATDLQSQNFFPVTGSAGLPGVYAGPVKGRHFCWGDDFDVTGNALLNNAIDTLEKKVGSAAIPIQEDALGAFKLAVAHESAVFGCRTIAASLPFAALVESGDGTLDGLMGRYIDFFENGWPPCTSVHQCNDSEVCTFDACTASVCVNSDLAGCIPCEDDVPCTAAAAAKACDVSAGLCGDLPGTKHTSTDGPLSIAYGAPVESTLTIAGTGIIQAINLKIAISHNYRGDLEIVLSHAGLSKTLKLSDVTDNGSGFHFTWDYGIDVDLSDLAGTGENGPWTLTVTDLGVPFHGSLTGWSLFIVNDTVPTCTVSGDCDDGNACTIDTCNSGFCQFVADPCDDATACQAYSHCDSAVGCVYEALDCDDGNPCTTDSCDAAAGCESETVQYCTGVSCTTHADCGYDDYCHPVTALCTPIPADEIHHCWDQLGVCPQDVGDLATVSSGIMLSDTVHYISGIRVKVKMIHTASGQLAITLSNGFETLVLHQLTGGTTDDVFKVYEIADAAHTPGDLDQLLNFHPAGPWNLQISDTAVGDTGSLEYWTLYVDLEELKDDGDPCTYQDECASDYCGNGFCCAGSGTGDCCALAADCLNHDSLVYWAAPTCDDALTCQGHGQEPSCTDNECVITSLADDSGCDGEIAAPCTDCRPQPVCTDDEDQDDPAVRCPETCGNDDAECLSACHCDGTLADPGGICADDLLTGEACVEESDCADGLHCQNGVCCSDSQVCCTTWAHCPNAGGIVAAEVPLYSAPVCGGTPSTCQGTRQDKLCDTSQCTYEYVNDDQGCGVEFLHSNCGFYPSVYCDGTVVQAPACATSCVVDGDCDANAHCTAGACVGDYDDGHSCDEGDGQGDAECVSAHCLNGFCCAAGDCCAADGDCAGLGDDVAPWCASPSTCQGFRQDPLCVSWTCASGAAVDDDSACDQLLSCAPYLYASCDGTADQPAAACPTTCESDADCVPTAHCRVGPPDGLKHCYYKKYDGQDCDGDYECVSGNCGGPVGQEVCCAAGEICCPDNDPTACPGAFTLPPVCGDPGHCQGTQMTVSCATWVCGNTAVPEDSGCTSVYTADAIDCGCYPAPICDGTAVQNPTCATSCVVEEECAAGCYCSGTCVNNLSNGDPCDEDLDCASGFCSPDGVCCDTACDSTCLSCIGAWNSRTIAIDGDYEGADDFDALGHLVGIGAGDVSYLLTWDADYLYVSWEQPFPAQHNVYIALDVDPAPDPDSGVADEFGGITFPGERKPEYAVKYSKQDSLWLATDVAGSWDVQDVCSPFDCWLNFVGHPLNYIWEVRIPRSQIPLWDPDAGFALWMWASAQNDKDIFSIWPSSNGVGEDVAAEDAQFMTSGAGMCRKVSQNTDPDGECVGDCSVCDGQGACAPAVEGTDPEDECSTSLPGTCGTLGACGAAGGCAWWPDTTPCAAQHCLGTVEVGASFCSGASPGSCDPVGDTDCFPHICAVDACVDPCADNTHCVGGYYCNDRPLNGPSTEACEALLVDGLYCDEDSDCDHGHCVEVGDVGQGPDVGVCCATACSGHCNTCGTGACAAHGDFSDPDNDCGGCQVCDGAGACRGVDPVADPSSDPKNHCSQQSLPIAVDQWDCGQSGGCDGAGACEKWHDGEACHTAQCLNCQIDQLADLCEAGGLCADQGVGGACAGGLACASGVECGAACDADSDCCTLSGGQLCHAAETCSPCDDAAICPSDGSTCCGSDSCGDLKEIPLTEGTFTYLTATQGAADDASNAGAGIGSPDRIFALNVGASPVELTVNLTGTNTGGGPVDTYLFVRSGDCTAGAVVAANADCGGDPGAGSCVTVVLAASTTYYLVADGQGGPTDKGDLSLEVTVSFFCGNGVCDPGEVCGVCADCSPCCGDGACDLLDGENSCTCAADCDGSLASGNACNDGCCSAWDCATSCDADCGMCADCGFCSAPVGELEGETPQGGTIHALYGWACDPDHAGDPVTIELFDNGLTTGVTTPATALRPDDPGGASCTDAVGFSTNLILNVEGAHTITALALSPDPGEADAWLGGSVCIGVCGTKVCGDDGCGAGISCGTCSAACQHDGDGTYSGQTDVCAAGVCVALTPCSEGYACDGPISKADGAACAVVCASNDDDYCAADFTCETTACVPKLPDGDPCDEDKDCLSDSCRKEVSSGLYYCAAAGKECSDLGGSGYDTGETEDPWICTGPNASQECSGATLCDTWVGHFCRTDLTWGIGTGVSYTCNGAPFCDGAVRFADRRCNGAAGAAGACDLGGDFGPGCDAETALNEEHCAADVWTGVGATLCCEDNGAGVGVATDPCAGKDAECVGARTCADGADACAMVVLGTTCNVTGYCISSDPDWCTVGKPNGEVCAADYECASKNCDLDLAGVSRCHATATSCVQDLTGAETSTGAGFCVNGAQYRPCTNATWSGPTTCTGCRSCSLGACIDDDTNCALSAWDGCLSTCVKTRSNNGLCTGGVCGTESTFVGAGTVCSGGVEIAASAGSSCDTQVACVSGGCAASTFYRGCSGSGVACSDTGKQAAGSWSADAGSVISENANHTAGTPAGLSCLTSSAALCDGTDHCAGDDRYDGFTCNGAGACTQDKTDLGCCAHSDCAVAQYCDTDYTCKALSLCGKRKSGLGQEPQAAVEDLRSECNASGWDGCAATCLKTRSSTGTCSGSSYACGTSASFLAVAGTVCSAGVEVAPVASNRCDQWIECAAGACSAGLFHRGCAAGAITCTDTGRVAGGTWSASYGTSISDTGGKVGATCNTSGAQCNTADHCFGDDRYSGYVCDGSGSCDAHSNDLGCCAHSDCASSQYCRASDYSCQALSTCGKRSTGSYGEIHQANTEDLRGECALTGCASGLCLGTDFACNPDGKIAVPDSVVGGTRSCPGSVNLQVSGSTGSYHWFDVPSGGDPLGSGPSFDTPDISATTTYYVSAVEAYPFPAHVLVFDENCLSPWATPYKDAMDNLAWSYTRAFDEVDFIDKLTDGTVWDLVIFDRYYYITPSSVYDLLYAYLAGGGKLIFSNWKFTSHALFSAMDVSLNTTFYSGKPIYSWNTAHPLYMLPNVVSGAIAFTQDTCNVDGFTSYVIGGGTAVSGFTPSVQSGQAAVVINSEGATIYMAEMPHLFNEAVLGDFLENQLMWMATDGWTGPGSGGICSSARLPVIAEIGSLSVPTAPDVTVTCGDPAPLTASGSTGKYEWYDAASGGTHLESGSTYTTGPISSSSTYYVQAVESYATNADVLVYDSDCTSPWLYPYTDVLADMGLTYTQATSETAFFNQLQAQSWDLVIYNEYSWVPATATLDALQSHLTGGGKLIYASWASSTHGLFTQMNVSFSSGFSAPLDIHAWDTSHELFTTPNLIPSVLEPAWNTCGTEGRRLINNGGVAVAGFTAAPAYGNAAVIVGASGDSIYMGEVAFAFNQATLQEFLENQIAYLIGVGDGCISPRVPVTVSVVGSCGPTCDHTIRLYDSWGDGWNGGSVDVYVNGVLVLNDATLASGFGPATYSFSALDGATIQVNYSGGGWPYENYYRVYDGSGAIIMDQGCGGSGCAPSPVATSTAVCPAGCPHEIRLYDTWGDGWNGGMVDVYVGGVLVLDNATLVSGSGPATYSFDADDGDPIQVFYAAGSWPWENYYQVYDGTGGLIILQTAGDGSGTGNCP